MKVLNIDETDGSYSNLEIELSDSEYEHCLTVGKLLTPREDNEEELINTAINYMLVLKLL